MNGGKNDVVMLVGDLECSVEEEEEGGCGIEELQNQRDRNIAGP